MKKIILSILFFASIVYADPSASQSRPQVKIWDGTDTAGVTASGALQTDSSGTTQPVSGTVTANQGTAGSGAWPVKISQTTTDNDVDTELPAAVTLADALSLPTTALIGAVTMGYNGSTLDLIRSQTDKALNIAIVANNSGTAVDLGL